jgi:hypothetical protein
MLSLSAGEHRLRTGGNGMAQAQLTVPYFEGPRNRLTVAFRLILVIPHAILLYVFNIAAEVVTVLHWFVQVFTGKRNEGMFNFVNKWLGYTAHVWTYEGLLYDQYPGFVDDDGKTPVRYQMVFDAGPVNRLTVALRFLWAIPAAVIGLLLGIGGVVMTIITWFIIVFTGKMPRGQYDFLIKVHQYAVELYAYTSLLTDEYPKYARAPAPGQPLTAPPVL